MTTRRRPLAEIPTRGDGPLVGPLLRQAARWFETGITTGLARHGVPRLTVTQIDIISKIDTDGITIAELARRAGITRQSAHQAVGELTGAGMLRVTADPGSARAKLVRPTPMALSRLELARELLGELERELATRIGPRRLEQLRTALDQDWGEPPTGE